MILNCVLGIVCLFMKQYECFIKRLMIDSAPFIQFKVVLLEFMMNTKYGFFIRVIFGNKCTGKKQFDWLG